MLNRLRILPVGLLAAAATLLSTGTAHAAVLTPTAQGCGNPQTSQAFLAWSDPASYFLAPDGNFANSGTTWALSGGAAAVSGGDGVSLGGNPVSTESLSLPSGSSATTPTICVGTNNPSLRFMVQNTGSANSTLRVSVTASTTLGLNLTLPIADISAGSTWNPSSVIPIVANLLTLLPGNMTPVTFTFTPQGPGASFQMDDLYIDPFARCC